MQTLRPITTKRLLLSLIIPHLRKGFTLIELLVVIIILGVLSAIVLPNLFSQIGKAREAEAKQILSAIGQAQQAYFFEKGTFSNNHSALEISFQSNYYNIPNPSLFSPVVAKSQANATGGVENNTRNFGMGVYYVNQTYAVILCQSLNPATLTVAPDDSLGFCSNSGKKLF
jgi:type IV pilus assembly protein PilA